MGEPVHMDKDFWVRGYGRIAVVPSVNVAYDMEVTEKVREEKGTVEDWYKKEGNGCHEVVEEWVDEAPKIVKCFDMYEWSSEWRSFMEGA